MVKNEEVEQQQQSWIEFDGSTAAYLQLMVYVECRHLISNIG